MSYNKKIWANGDLITKEGMNNIEDGIYDAHDKINTINNKVEENTNDTNTARQDISDIKLQIGTEELATKSKKLKGAINELGSQIKDIEVNKISLQKCKEEIAKAQLEGSGVDTSNFAMQSDIRNIANKTLKKGVKEGTTVNVNKENLDGNSYFRIKPTELLVINKKMTLNGTESWWVNGSVNKNGYYAYSLTLKNITSSINAIENMRSRGLISSSDVNFECYSLGTNGILTIFSMIDTLDTFKVSLSNKNLTLYYSTNSSSDDSYYLPINIYNDSVFSNTIIPVSTNDFSNGYIEIDERGNVLEVVNNTVVKSSKLNFVFPKQIDFYIEVSRSTIVYNYYEAYDMNKFVAPYKTVGKTSNCDYRTIQEAIDNSENNTTIYIMSGEYEEAVDFKSKVIHLIGENKLTTKIFNTTGEYNTCPLWCTAGSIKNLTIHAKRIASSNPSREGYAIHLDSKFPSNVNDRKFECDNCIVISDFNDAFGAGTYEQTYYYITNTVIITTNGGACFKCHQGSTQKYAEINLANIIMKCNDESTTPLLFHDGGAPAVGKTKVNMNNVHVRKWFISNQDQYELGEYNYGNSIPSMNTLTLI